MKRPGNTGNQISRPSPGKYVIAPHPGLTARWAVWHGHRVVHEDTKRGCARWAKANQAIDAPGVEWTRTDEPRATSNRP